MELVGSKGQSTNKQEQFLIIFLHYSKQSLPKSFERCLTSVSIFLTDFTGCHHHSAITNTDNCDGNGNYGDHEGTNPGKTCPRGTSTTTPSKKEANYCGF